MVLASIRCPHCAASSETIRAWRTVTRIMYLCGICDHLWTIDVEPATEPTNTTNIIARLGFFKR
jgi:transcription elongation factor Elf1